MAVDRGELRYSIRLTLGSTFRNLRRFRDELKANRDEFRTFRTQLRAAGADAKRTAVGFNASADALERLNAATGQRRALNQQTRDARRARQAFSLLVRELRQIRTVLQRVETQAKRTGNALGRAGAQGERGANRGRRGFQRLRREVQRTEGRANALAGSFLRMGGIISGFVVAQGIISGIRELISSSIQFNRTIERSELGIAAILTAVGEVRGAFGATVSQAEQLTLATAEAREQTQQLRRDALTTAATFEQLIDVFQIALAPGLTAGLDVDEVRRFSLRISQAALALGVAQNQLSEEVRAILAGTIRPQTTRIATALGITNEDIRNARELGTLAEFLQERFAAFGAAGERALDTIDGLIGRVVDGFQQLSGEAGRSVGFFDNVKDSLRGLLDLFLDFDEFGFPSPDPQTLAVLQVFFEAINEGFETLLDTVGDISFEDALDGARAFGEALVTAVELIIGLVQGLTDGFAFLGQVIRGVADALGFDESEASVREIARALTSILVIIISIRAGFGLVLGAITPIATAAAGIFRLFRGIFVVLLGINTRLGIMAGIMRAVRAIALATSIQFGLLSPALQAAIVSAGRLVLVLRRVAIGIGLLFIGVQQVIRAFTGLELSLGETAQVIFLAFETLFTRIRFGGLLIFQLFANGVLVIIDTLITAIVRNFAGAFSAIAGGLGAVAQNLGIITKETRDALEDILVLSDRIKAGGRLLTFRFDDAGTIADQEEALDKINKKIGEIAVAADKRKQAEADAAFELERQKDAAEAAARGITVATEAAETFSETISRITANFSNVRTIIGQTQDATNRLRDTLLDLNFQEAFEVDPDLSGIAARIATTAQKEQITLAKELFRIRQQQTELEARAARSLLARTQAEETFLQLTEREQQLVLAIDDAVVRQGISAKNISDLDKERREALVETRNAIQEGNAEEEAAGRKKITSLTQQIALQEAQATALEKQIDLVTQTGDFDEEALKFIKDRLAILSEQASAELDVEAVKKAILDLEKQSLEVQRRTAELSATRGLADAEARVTQLQLEAALLIRISTIEAEGGSGGAAIRLRQLESQTAELQLQNLLARQKQLANASELQSEIQRLSVTGGVTTALQAQLDALLGQINAQAQLSAEQEAQLERERERARILAEGTAGEVIGTGIEDFIEAVGTIQEQLAQFTTNLLQQFSSGLSNALVSSFVNAFDETGKFITDDFIDGLEQAAGQLLQQIATQLLQTVIDSLLSTILAAFTTGVIQQATAAETIAAAELANATLINTSKITAATAAGEIEIAAATTAAAIRAAGSAASAATGGMIGGIQGFDGGGHVGFNLPRTTPPKGIARGDTVAAHLTPGEFVQRVSAVRNYGVDFMRALNRGLIDPAATRGLMGVRKMSNFQTATSRGPGFQEGGSVSENIRQVQASIEAQIGESAAGENSPVVALPVDDNTFETQLAAGKATFRRFLRDGAHDFDGILRGGRTGG